MKHNSISTLFRLLFNDKNANEKKIVVALKLYSALPEKNNCTGVILKHFLKQNHQIATTGVVNKSEDIIIDIKPEKMEMHDDARGELFDNYTDNLGEKLRKMMEGDKTQAEKNGLLVDWLTTIEIEITDSHKQKLQVFRHVIII